MTLIITEDQLDAEMYLSLSIKASHTDILTLSQRAHATIVSWLRYLSGL